jgi:hypothetical protein
MVVYDPEDPYLSLYDVDDGKYFPYVVASWHLSASQTAQLLLLSDWYHVLSLDADLPNPWVAKFSLLRP